MVSPVNSSSLVAAAPIFIGIIPSVTGMPMPRAAGCPNSVPSAANTMSQAPIRSRPPDRQ